ncbi:arginine--tRNA ligase [Shimia sp. Alg240-R146]|uniref:arginine--tRNA ligase n=1 Tax=Shimia sp. Alg240-R146 TaxID=2993449 RepID=UPI0022E6C28A|nr:arginine--tRNA ligase [Shimia sp. Alg240-R146]
MNLFTEMRALVIEALTAMQSEGVLPEGLDFKNVAVEPPRDALHGDMATNAAMVLAKPAKMKPRDIADVLAAKLMDDVRVEVAEVAGPGFLNMRLAANLWQGVVKAALVGGVDFGRSDMGAGKSANVEYVSANPTGPLHVGHCRGAVFGDALAGLLAYCGYDVTREYWVNDAGGQVDVLARSAYERYREANGLEFEVKEGLYPGDYLVPVGEALKEKFGDSFIDKPESDWLVTFRDITMEEMLRQIREDLEALNVNMQVWTSERSYYESGKIEKTLEELREMGLVYRGVLEPPKGKEPDGWEPREQTLFKATEYGDDVDRPVQKSDGGWTYFAPDLAYHYDKVKRGFDVIIDVFGADHGGYVKRMKAIVAALDTEKRVHFDIKLTQLVKLFKNGEPFKMSKRAGTFITLRDVIEQVGPDVTRFVMLTRRNDAPLDFDFDKVLEQSKDNPVFYVQYAHARVCSVLRKATDAGIVVDDATLAAADLTKLGSDAEITVAKKIAEWPRLVEIAGRTNEPHRVAFYLYELASELHSLWNKGNDDTSLRFIQEDDAETSQAKIALARSVAVVISAGLGILGVTPAQEMR